MTDPAYRPGHLAAAALTLGGLLLIGVPQRAPSIIRLVLVTLAAAGGLHLILAHGSPAFLLSPFRWTLRDADDQGGSADARRLRSALEGRRHRIAGGPPLPPATIRILQPLIEAALDRDGAGPDSPLRRAAALQRLSATTRAILAHDATVNPPWFRTVRSDADRTAEAVSRVLDELDLAPHLDASTSGVP